MSANELNKLYTKRSQMEKRMSEIIDFLCQKGTQYYSLSNQDPSGRPPVGLHGNLLDENGYPRDDIDIIQVSMVNRMHNRSDRFVMNWRNCERITKRLLSR